MKVLFLDQNASLGGGQRVLLDLMLFFREAGHEPLLMLPSEGYVTGEARRLSIPVSTFDFMEMTPGKKGLLERLTYPFAAFRASSRVEEFALFHGAAMIFANGPRIYLPAALAGRELGIPVHLQLHLLFEKGLEKELIAFLLRSGAVSSGVCCSNKVFAPFSGMSPLKMKMVPYWVSPPFLEAPSRREELRARYGIGSGRVAAGVIGRISPTKGQKLFLEAAMPLLAELPELDILFAGSSDFENPGEEEELKKAAESSGFAGRIKFLGMVEGLDFYDCLDILAVPSVWEEPFGLVAVEGMARKLPIIVTRSGALAETVEDGRNGFVVEKNPLALGKALRELSLSPSLREEMGGRGRLRVEEHFHPRRQMALVMEAAVNGL